MVNELNKQPNGDNAALSERLAASNRQLQEMQEEHRQLLLEMETLRARAAELTLLNAQRQQLRQVSSIEEETVVTAVQQSPDIEIPSESEPAEEQEDSEENKEETANYLQQKLNEIANLKGQFKRIQQMVDTTKLIEQHISSKESHQSIQQESIVQAISSSSSSSTRSTEVQSHSRAEALQTEASSSSTGPTAAAPDNAEMLNDMLNMFTDFTSDLRGQAESLRAERDRIRTLKEEIIQRKQGK